MTYAGPCQRIPRGAGSELDAIGAGVRLLPLTGMLIVGAPLPGAVITRIGSRVPMVVGMLLAAGALFGLSRIGMTSSLTDTILWFAMLGLALSPVMVGATEVIVGNASVELADVAGGLQSTAMQLAAVKSAATVGVAPVRKGIPAQAAAAIADVTHATFVSGMTAAFLVACIVAIGGALIALLTKKGNVTAEARAAVHI